MNKIKIFIAVLCVLIILSYTQVFVKIIAKQKNDEGLELESQGNLNGAITLYTEAIELNPDNAEYYYNRGNVCRYVGNYEQAISDFDKAIEINPIYVEAYNKRGLTNYMLKNYAEAVFDFSKAIKIDPNSYDSYVGRCYCYEELGQMDKAKEDVEKAQQLSLKH